jgi:hypothetical protein
MIPRIKVYLPHETSDCKSSPSSRFKVLVIGETLSAYFPEIATVIRRCRESRADRARAGGSRWPGLARITPRDCALPPIPAAAPGRSSRRRPRRSASAAFRLLRRDNTHVGRDPHEPRSLPYQGERIVTLVDFIAAKIERGSDPDHLPLGWCIGAHEACDGTPGGLGDCIERLTKLPMSLFADIAGLFAESASCLFKDVRCVRSVAPQGAA